MESSSLDSVLSGQAAPEVVEQPASAETPPPEVQEPEAATGEEAGTPPETQKDDPLEKHRKGLEAAASAERKRRQEAEQRAQALEQQLRALQQPQPTHQVQQTPDIPKPQRSQFETEDEWLDARDAWRDQVRERQAVQQRQAQAEFVRSQKTQSIFAEAMKLPGFDLQAFHRLPVPEPMADAILESDAAPQLVHFLTANPDEAYRIAGLSPARQIKELTRIEDKLTASPQQQAQPETKEKPRLPESLTQARDARGRFEPAYSGPTPLTSILK